MHSKAAILQIHTTGPDLSRDFVIQVGLRPLQEKAESIIEYYKPGGHINRLALYHSGLKPKLLESKPYFGEHQDRWADELAQYDWIYYFPGTTADHEPWYMDKLGLDPERTRCVNLQRLTNLFFPNINDPSIDSLYSFLFQKPFPTGKDIMTATLLAGEKELELIVNRMLNKDYALSPVVHELVRMAAIQGGKEMVAIEELAKSYQKTRSTQSLWMAKEEETLTPKAILRALHTVTFHGDSSARIKSETETQSTKFETVSSAVLRAFFDTPYLKKSIRKFEERPQQITYTNHILNNLNSGGRLIIEAPTGIGKSIGYLAPIAFILERNPNAKIVVATATKNLQDQVLTRDWPLLGGRFPELKIASLKGKGNYLCWSALLRAFETYVIGGNGEEITAWLALLFVALETGGDLESISGVMQNWLPCLDEIIHEVCADIHCNARMCTQEVCFYQHHIQEAEQSKIIVTNHHKVMGLPIEIEPAITAIIIDEADRFPDNARNSLSQELNTREISFFIRRQLGTERRRGFLAVLETRLDKQADDYPAALERIGTLKRDMESFIFDLDSFHETLLTDTESFRPARLVEFPIFKTGKTLEGLLKPVLSRAKTIQSKFEILSDLDSLPTAFRYRCNGYAREMKAITDKILAVQEGFNTSDTVHHIEEYGSAWSLVATPVYLDQILSESLYKRIRSIVFSSATLFINDTVDLMSRELGLTSEKNLHSERISSSFHYRDQVYCGIDASIPPFNWRSKQQRENYLNAVAKAIIVYTIAANGRSLVLFTSLVDMKRVYRMVAPVLQKYDIVPIIQRGSSLYETRLFRDIEFSVLFGVDRFWYGVDFPGATLSQVLIAKAPNPNLSHPVIRHRLVHEKDFMSRTYPALAALRLRQGFGRLIRSRSDKGAVILLDSRYGRQPHQRDHLKELPVPCVVEVQKSSLMEKALKSAHLWNEFQERRIDPFMESPVRTDI